MSEKKDNSIKQRKNELKVAVLAYDIDVSSKKVFRVLKRSCRAYYATQFPKRDDDIRIDLSRVNGVRAFLEYYEINVVVMCSSIIADLYREGEEKSLLNLIDYCISAGIKLVMLCERHRIISDEGGRSVVLGYDDHYGEVCDMLAEKVLSSLEGLVIECYATYGFDIDASEEQVRTDYLEACEYSRMDAGSDCMPLLIDEVAETLDRFIDRAGKFVLPTDRKLLGQSDEMTYSDLNKGKEILTRQRGCVFNLIYQMMPEDFFGNERVAKVRFELGKSLAQNIPKSIASTIDYIVPVPMTGLYYAMGLSEELSVPYVQGIMKNTINERSFQLVDINVRKTFLSNKIVPLKEFLVGKKVMLVDEAIFTGTTLKMVCRMLWEVGVESIFIGIPTPQCYCQCEYYMQPKREMLLEYIREDMLTEYFDVDGVYFQRKESFIDVVPNVVELCTECFTWR